MIETLTPKTAEQVLATVRWAAAEQVPLALAAGGTKGGLGRPVQAGHTLDLSALKGIALYEPDELVLSAAPGTPLAEIETLLADNQQELGFEPPDLGPLFGVEAGRATIGGTVSAGLSGPRRIKAGAARDHVLGVHGVSGRGEAFKAGGRVVKNVTGYDVAKLVTGAHGTLAALTRITMRVLPQPEAVRTVLLFGLDDARAVRALTLALQSSCEVSGAAHLPRGAAARSGVPEIRRAGWPVTAVRVEGFGPSVAYRCERLRALFKDFGLVEILGTAHSRHLWRELRNVQPFVDDEGGDERAVWRLSVAPSDGPAVAADLSFPDVSEHFFDWGGGLLWLALPAGEDAGAGRVHAVVADHGGHATLIRAPEPVRAAVPVFQPQPPALAALTARIKDSFDPKRILNPERMYAGV